MNTEDTFRQPFLDKVRKALTDAVSICWDDCHKIYINLDQAAHDQMISFDYNPIMVTDKEDAVKTLYDWFEISCSLRFIQSIRRTPNDPAAGFDDIIAQFEYPTDDYDGTGEKPANTEDTPEPVAKHADHVRDASRDACFQQGENANDNNRSVYRTGRGQTVSCPYEAGTDQAKWWREGYEYRDMVNDG